MSEDLIPGFEFEEGLFSPPVDTVRLGAEFPVTIGRRGTNDLVLHHSSVSGGHAQIERMMVDDKPTYYVQDLGSTNGTSIEGEPVQRRLLNNGDLVRFGDVGLRFGLLPWEWWEESRADYLTSALPWPLAVPFFKARTAANDAERVEHVYRLCEEMTRMVAASGAAVAAANGGADSALRWALTRLRKPTPMDWIGSVTAVIRAGSDRGWLQHLPGLIESSAGEAVGTEGAWDALKQWVRKPPKTTGEHDAHEYAAVLSVLEPGVISLLLAWTFLHEGRMIWVEREGTDDWSFRVHVCHGARPATVLEGVRFYGHIPGERVPYWILSAAGGAACLAPWYRVNPDPDAPIVSWEGCPDDMIPNYRAADSGEMVTFEGDELKNIPMGTQGAYQWKGFKDYLAADRTAGAVVDLQMPPDDWANILGVATRKDDDGDDDDGGDFLAGLGGDDGDDGGAEPSDFLADLELDNSYDDVKDD